VTKLYAPHPHPVDDPGERREATPEELADIEARTARHKYLEAIRSFRPMRSNFHDRLSEAAGLGSNEEDELEQLVTDWKRLKRGD